MAIDFTMTATFNVAAIIIIGIATIFGAKTVKRLYTDEFAATINWLLIIIEAVFLIQFIIFLAFYFSVNPMVSTVFVLMSTILVAMLFFFATYKILHFLQKYVFDRGELSKQSIEELVRKRSNGKN